MTGPTTVGSIDAKLGIDKSGWDQKAAEVKAEARELGALDPTVKVDANVAGALSKLGAVAKAERDLDVAYQRSAISQDKLAAVTKKWGDDSTQAAAARLTLTRALNAEQDAEGKLSAAKGRDTAETDKNTDSTNRNNEALHGRRATIANLIALAPAIVAAAAPIGAAAVGLGAAFGVMAASGVLAVVGIKQAMAQGTTAGLEYKAGLTSLKGTLDTLAQTAAVRMLGSFQDAVDAINTNLPFLNTLVGNSAAALGRMGSTALAGVIAGLQAANPLIQEGAAQLNAFIGWLSAMPSSNGFTTFVTYAVDNLPSVMQLIEGLVTSAGHILAAFAPLGPVVIGFLNGLTTVINDLPLPVLAGLVTTATSLGIALRIVGSGAISAGITAVAEAIGLTGVMANLAVPVVGILLAAVAGVAVGAASAAASQGQATMAVQDYTQALRDDNNALGEHVRQQAAKALSDEGAFEAAQRLGISQSTLTDAAMGMAGAQQQVADKVAAAKDKVQAAADATSGYVGATTDSTSATDGFVGAIDTVNKAIDVNKSSIDRGRQANLDMAAAMDQSTGSTAATAAALGMTVTAYQQAVAAQAQTQASTEATTASMKVQDDAAGLLKQAWDALNGKTITAAQAQNTFDSSLVNMGDHMTATGKKVHFTTTSINDMSSASVALRGQVIGQINAMEGVIEANGGVQKMTASSRAEYVKMRQAIIDNAVAHGVDREAITKLVDSMYKIPPLTLTKTEVLTAEAHAQLARFQAAIDALHGKEVWITSHVNSIYSETHTSNGVGGSGGQTKSDGGTIYRAGGGPVYLAGGGFSRGPIGSDTVPAWLTPGEHVMKRSSAESIGAPALKYMNDTGKLPNGGQNITVYVTNPFTGEQVMAVVHTAATNAVNAGFQQANNDAGRRPSR
jgi:hypothetical protein